MFDDSARDMTAWLAEAERQARIKSNFSQSDAGKKLSRWIEQDSRFDEYDSARLAERVVDCIGHGAVLDLSDPYLTKGGQRRPGDKRYVG